MKRRFIHLQLTFVFACMLLFALTICSYAAEGFEGYAVYRDGAFLGTTWHGGLMDGAHPKKEKPVTHAAQSKSTVQSGSWGSFINGNTFKGFYYPKSGVPTSAKRDLIKAMGKSLIDENILYTPIQQIDYKVTDSTWVLPSDITKIRCDGVVEYCYEYYGFRIFGNDTYWNISRMGSAYKSHHALATVTPKKQSEEYMTKWSHSGKIIYIVNRNSGKVLDVRGPSSANGTAIQQWDYANRTNQKFKMVYTASGNFYSFVPQNATSAPIEVENNSTENGTKIQIWAKPSSGYLNSQRFRIVPNSDGSYKITTYATNYQKVIEVGSESTSNGASVDLWSDNGRIHQHWYLVPA